MKKITILGLILLGLGFSPSLVSADIPMGPGWHYVESCVKVVNMNDFPDVVLVADYFGVTADGSEGFIINNDECIRGGYKFNDLNVYWTTKDKIKSIDLKNLEVEKTKNRDVMPAIKGLSPLMRGLPFYAGELEDKTNISAINRDYILKQTGGELSLIESKKTTEYNNGKSPKVEILSNSDVKKEIKEIKKEAKEEIKDLRKDENPSPYNNPVKRGFWYKISCFFGFGKNC